MVIAPDLEVGADAWDHLIEGGRLIVNAQVGLLAILLIAAPVFAQPYVHANKKADPAGRGCVGI